MSVIADVAIEMIDHELDTAREKAEQAQADYDALLAAAQERRDNLQAKIDSLTS